ncbi:FtsK/SpoIIIE domain-containing protein [Microbacterium sp. P02]|uniref:FtsK/SpoIIIE domain-containing protein n=1 Tax=Microbacterium sp. P02 TaxID=3366260 RepID=UPI00366D6FB4
MHTDSPSRARASSLHTAVAMAGDDEPLSLPPAWTPPARAPLPILAATVPVVGAIGLWVVTGSLLSLWFAALGPLIALASVVDAGRAARRSRRRAESDAAAARARLTEVVREQHGRERAGLWDGHPDVALYLARAEEIWRAVPGRMDALVVGAGAGASAVRVTGGIGDAASAELRADAARLDGAPIVVAASEGVAVLGPPILAAAVVRALATQLCLASPPSALRVVGTPGDDEWIERMPHHGSRGGTTLAVLGPDDPVPADADLVIQRALTPHGAPRCTALLTVASPDHGRLDYVGEVVDVRPEALAAAQAAQIGDALAERWAVEATTARDGPAPIALADLLADSTPTTAGLEAVIGVQAGRPFCVDLLADGPHAVVAGVTGSGKSELLITWVLSMCATRTIGEVTFLLADFKGGTAFDALAGLPHVTGVITDLDGSGARRAIESLRAEVRWRETELARSGARDVSDDRVGLPRLVIVVDEFAALVDAHPELQAVFTDVAARGRALGMHLILGTQRVAGVIRDALLTNCPLRLSLRVTDAADSRAVVGTDQAAALPGSAEGRGLALVRRASDAAPHPIRIALSTAEDIDGVGGAAGPRPRRPWLPDLPDRIGLDELRGHGESGLVVLGLIDEPDRQRQRPAKLTEVGRGLLVVGARGSGKSAVLQTIAAQCEAVWLPSDPERAWDAVSHLREGRGIPEVLLIDDIDALAARFPHEYGRTVLERVEEVVRASGSRGTSIVVTAQRPSPATARITDLLMHRAILGLPTRADHIAAGGDPSHFTSRTPPGRGRLDGQAIQFALVPSAPVASSPHRVPPAEQAPAWHPSMPVTGYVGRRSAATRAVLEVWRGGGARIVPLADAAATLSVIEGGPVAAPTVVAGDPDEWQRHWSVFAVVRGEHDLVIDATCAPEYRILTGERELPPYCAPGRSRAWLRRADGPSERIVLPDGSAAAVLDLV